MEYDSDYETRGLNPKKKTFHWYLENTDNNKDYQEIQESTIVYLKSLSEMSDFINLRRFQMKELHFSNCLRRKKEVCFDDLFDPFVAVHSTPMIEVESLKITLERITLGTEEKIKDIARFDNSSFNLMFGDIHSIFNDLKNLECVYYFAVGVTSLERTRLLVKMAIQALRNHQANFHITVKFDFSYETERADKEKDLIKPLKIAPSEEFIFEKEQLGGHKATAVVDFESNGFNIKVIEVYHLEPL
uniref:Uncharacterized protein n=1 Tax=Panagrolaimus sp. JU765 TaxID=591449 RepID=A0AC34R6P0_9BILA